MQSGIISVYAAAAAQQELLELVANNLANLSTPAFKEDRPVFSSYLQASPPERPALPLPIPELRAVRTNFAQEGFRHTGNPLDLALDGPGFFKVKTPRGERFTRKGQFTLDTRGRLVTGEGFPVLNESGGEIAIPAADLTHGAIQIDKTGQIKAGGMVLDKIAMMHIPEPEKIRKEGNSLFAAQSLQEIHLCSDETTLRQGFLELSNVSPIQAMTSMIELARAYEVYQKVIQTFDEATQKAINEVGRATR